MVSIAKVEIKFRQMYTCSKCKTTAEGTTAHLTTIAYSNEQLSEVVKDLPRSALCMPVSWASFYHKSGPIFKCGECK